jgi:hypothetical protein
MELPFSPDLWMEPLSHGRLMGARSHHLELASSAAAHARYGVSKSEVGA